VKVSLESAKYPATLQFSGQAQFKAYARGLDKTDEDKLPGEWAIFSWAVEGADKSTVEVVSLSKL
jgi:hypothetical protein